MAKHAKEIDGDKGSKSLLTLLTISGVCDVMWEETGVLTMQRLELHLIPHL
jgi:hypothetical protein